MADGEWSIGALARASGVTVRALHHYDRIGLLTPRQRTGSGHRRYSERDVRQLYRIRALRSLGLSLAEIAGVLADRADDLTDLRELLVTQLDGLDRRATLLDELRDRIRGLLGRIDTHQMPEPDQFMATLEGITVHEHYFTAQQRDRLAERRAELGADAVDAARTAWVGLVEQLLPHAADGTPVDDPDVVDLVARWDALGAEFVPSSAPDRERSALRDAARRAWRDNSATLGATLPWPTDRMVALVGYIDRVRAARPA